MNYSDDFTFFCKRSEAPLLAEYLQLEFEAHGLELNLEKSTFEPVRCGVVLGVTINLEAGRFEIPPKKRAKILRGIKDLLEANRGGGGGLEARALVSARSLAKTMGRIMALQVVCGDVVRWMTRIGYACIAAATCLGPSAMWR